MFGRFYWKFRFQLISKVKENKENENMGEQSER
jgi:hypothetical protein